jgi:hypothetical protein
MQLNQTDGKIILSQTKEEIDLQTQAKIRVRYSEAEEYKIHRLALEALIAGNPVPQIYMDYQEYVKQCVEEGKDEKAKMFKKVEPSQ